uniref:FAM50A/XAP5 C-terminal domain-containing protein n=1 Tax=Attheya septentrionalis TaxID=420275 RepID=A0A7S2UBR5_9STRA|mmetsp:Transcript_16234/g.29534  ORF Transcript_16234/g.29534 Transcript_16234/m.29534 type:complete len:365 (+) Transcript_16234:38-1132(+)|eukprot:CAMPEP_0198281654 /NCGR_PEP_ID=MMETSP1449-20131203/1571_1 /TAXON_ID=420275 /ORGANISM="Attheya septentrionalis, Strain CCMP2084" /LENGTH=364 /DNA_ID=CAMNT_0043977541 /DNA_START=72 /DNA_END=1166 /DNA_ORIENTATION=+
MGDFSANFKRPDSGIHTVEGNVAGARAATLTKQREAQQLEFEERKRKLAQDAERGSKTIQDKFSGDSSLTKAEQSFRSRTVGLVTADEFRKATEDAAKRGGGGDEESVLTETIESAKELESRKKEERKARKRALKKKKKILSTLSFAGADDADFLPDVTEVTEKVAKRLKKDPGVDTSFLPDQERQEALEHQRDLLKQQWLDEQERIKKETLEIVYSYWDGSGHRRTVQVKKGDSIGHFLECVRRELAKEFRDVQNVSAEDLLYVKEDLMIPQDITFYDLIQTKARGKSGPLFHFDVHDDVRVGAIDTRVEKDESHPGKIVQRRWYDRNKHIFPASRWETFDPAKDSYGHYTIHGGEVNTSKNN